MHSRMPQHTTHEEGHATCTVHGMPIAMHNGTWVHIIMHLGDHHMPFVGLAQALEIFIRTANSL